MIQWGKIAVRKASDPDYVTEDEMSDLLWNQRPKMIITEKQKGKCALKVAFTVGKLEPTSGIVKVVVNIVNVLAAEKEYEITIICDEAPGRYLKLADNIKVISLDIYKNHKMDWTLMIKPLKRLFKNRNFDVLVISGMEFVPFYYFAAYQSSVRMYAWEHRNFGAGPKFRLEWFGKRLAVKKLCGVISITKKDKENYRNYCIKKGFDCKRLYQIYNLTDFAKTGVKYNSQNKNIISVGYLAHIKGFDMLIEVAAALLRKRNDWYWDIYGAGVEMEQLQSLIIEKHLENNVFMKGYCSNVYDKYSEYSMFVLTSRAEGMGMVLVEAQKSKLPVVSFDIDCGPSDVIEDNQNGYLVKPFDVEEMAEKINLLLNSEKKRIFFSNNSEIKHDEFEKKVILEKWKQILDKERL